MFCSQQLRTTALAALVAAVAPAGETDQILQVARATWPGPLRVGIVCNFEKNRASIEAMLDQFAPGSTVLVMDVQFPQLVNVACEKLKAAQPQFVLLLPKDPIVCDGSFYATKMILRMNHLKIPTLATTPKAISQGAWAAMGPATGNVLQVNPSLQGYIDVHGMPVSAPQGSKVSQKGFAPRAISVITRL